MGLGYFLDAGAVVLTGEQRTFSKSKTLAECLSLRQQQCF